MHYFDKINEKGKVICKKAFFSPQRKASFCLKLQKPLMNYSLEDCEPTYTPFSSSLITPVDLLK